jgi:hypothetical protein
VETAAVFLMRDLRNWLEKNTGREIPFYFVQGTEYHEGRGAEELESIAARVKGANIQSNFSGHCKEVLDLAVPTGPISVSADTHEPRANAGEKEW